MATIEAEAASIGCASNGAMAEYCRLRQACLPQAFLCKKSLFICARLLVHACISPELKKYVLAWLHLLVYKTALRSVAELYAAAPG